MPQCNSPFLTPFLAPNSFLIFLGVYNGIVQNYNLPRFVRYNAMQAVMLDVLIMWVLPACALYKWRARG